MPRPARYQQREGRMAYDDSAYNRTTIIDIQGHDGRKYIVIIDKDGCRIIEDRGVKNKNIETVYEEVKDINYIKDNEG